MAREVLAEETMQHIYEVIPHLVRLPSGKVWIDYDREADVLYLSLRRPQQATDTQCLDEQGILLRYRGEELVGITVLDASTRGSEGKQPRQLPAGP